MTKDDFVEWTQTMTMNPSTAWDLYCLMYPAQERKVMNLAQTTRFKKTVARKRHRSTSSSSSSSSSSRDSNKRLKVVDTCTPTLERIKCSLFNHLPSNFTAVHKLALDAHIHLPVSWEGILPEAAQVTRLTFVDGDQIQIDPDGRIPLDAVMIAIYQEQIPIKNITKDAIALLEQGRLKFLCTGPGKEYTDNHLTMLLAEAIQQFKNAAFQVISKDKGFAPVIANFAARGVSVELFKAIDHVLSIKNLYR